jgi:hypothetical protein
MFFMLFCIASNDCLYLSMFACATHEKEEDLSSAYLKQWRYASRESTISDALLGVLVLCHLLGELDLLLLLRALEGGDVVEQVFVLLVHSPAALRWLRFVLQMTPNQQARPEQARHASGAQFFPSSKPGFFADWLNFKDRKNN